VVEAEVVLMLQLFKYMLVHFGPAKNEFKCLREL